jgi:hypothetical protein
MRSLARSPHGTLFGPSLSDLARTQLVTDGPFVWTVERRHLLTSCRLFPLPSTMSLSVQERLRAVLRVLATIDNAKTVRCSQTSDQHGRPGADQLDATSFSANPIVSPSMANRSYSGGSSLATPVLAGAPCELVGWWRPSDPSTSPSCRRATTCF